MLLGYSLTRNRNSNTFNILINSWGITPGSFMKGKTHLLIDLLTFKMLRWECEIKL